MKQHAFTLAEILIAFALLGIVAAFVIPKVLMSAQSQQQNALAHEAEATLSQAYQTYSQNHQGTVSSSTTFDDLMDYVNVIGKPTQGVIDHFPNNAYGALLNCASTTAFTCYQLPNGGMFAVNIASQFGQTLAAPSPNTNRGMLVLFDPDGKQTNVPAIGFVLYKNGRITPAGKSLPNSGFESAVGGPLVDVGLPNAATLQADGSCPGLCDPAWFN